jgi:hypothetical protein
LETAFIYRLLQRARFAICVRERESERIHAVVSKSEAIIINSGPAAIYDLGRYERVCRMRAYFTAHFYWLAISSVFAQIKVIASH